MTHAAATILNPTGRPAAGPADGRAPGGLEPGGPDAVTGSPADRTRALPAEQGGKRRARGRVLRPAGPRIVLFENSLGIDAPARHSTGFADHIDAMIHAQISGRDTAILRSEGRYWLAPLAVTEWPEGTVA